ncbi:MAG: FkbM family methyltransferase [Blastocatellales bacterium]
MNFSGIPGQTLAGRLLRYPLKFIPRQMRMPILQGRLRGKKWIAGSSTHGCWLGSYEYDQRLLFERLVTEGSVVFDVGAHVGFYTLLAATLVGPRGRVYSFEPALANIHFLKAHLRLNRITNVTVIEKAVSDREGTARFVEGPSSAMGHFAEQGGVAAPTVSMDDLFLRGEVPAPDFIKIDVESAEWLALKGAEHLLRRTRPTIFLSTDIYDLHHRCCKFLESLGYQLHPIGDRSLDQAEEILAYRQAPPGFEI